MDYQEAFVKLFTDNPVNWAKWVVVFVVLVLGYRISIPLFDKVSYRLGREYKRDLARKRGHIIKAFILDQHPSGDVGKYDWHAKYEYLLDGNKKVYRAYFNHPNCPPRVIYLYYVNSPKRLFSMDEYHWDVPLGLIKLPIIFLPWILAVLTMVALQIPITV
mgnify:FL=1